MEVLRSDLFALAGRHHALIGQALGHLLDPVVEGRHQRVLRLEGRQQGLLELEVELNELQQPDLEDAVLRDLEQLQDVLDDFLEERVVVDGQLAVDVRGLPIFIHLSYILWEEE